MGFTRVTATIAAVSTRSSPAGTVREKLVQGCLLQWLLVEEQGRPLLLRARKPGRTAYLPGALIPPAARTSTAASSWMSKSRS